MVAASAERMLLPTQASIKRSARMRARANPAVERHSQIEPHFAPPVSIRPLICGSSKRFG